MILEAWLFLLMTIMGLEAACPGGIRIRKEIGDLTREELDRFINAIKGLQATGRYEEYEDQHFNNAHRVHNSAVFFPWHRMFLLDFENELRLIDPSVTVPYWDWSLD